MTGWTFWERGFLLVAWVMAIVGVIVILANLPRKPNDS